MKRIHMANILPVSDLRNYNEVLKNCQIGEPVFSYKILMKLQEAEDAVKDGEGWLTLDELKAAMEG